MKRRDFLKLTPAAGLAFMINGIPISTYADHPLLQMMAKSTASTGRVLIVIQLNGGNDGLNMVIPIDKYSELSNARSNILIPVSYTHLDVYKRQILLFQVLVDWANA